MKYFYCIPITTTIFFFLLHPSILRAQGTKEDKYYSNNDKKWLVEIPLWIPGVRGQLAYGDFDVSPSDRKEDVEFRRINDKTNIEFYIVGKAMFRSANWMIQLDAFSGKIGRTFYYTHMDGGQESELIYLTAQATLPRGVLGYTVWNNKPESDFHIDITPYIGTRYINIHLQTDVFGNEEFIDVHPDWFEFLAGLYIPISFKRLKFEVQVDYGTAQQASSWAINNTIRYSASKLIDFQIGWSLMNVKYNRPIRGQDLDFNLDLFGPTAGIGFRF